MTNPTRLRGLGKEKKNGKESKSELALNILGSGSGLLLPPHDNAAGGRERKKNAW